MSECTCSQIDLVECNPTTGRSLTSTFGMTSLATTAFIAFLSVFSVPLWLLPLPLAIDKLLQ